MIQHDDRFIARLDEIDPASFPIECENLPFVPQAFIAVEFRRGTAVCYPFLHRELAGRTCTLALALHRLLEPGLVYCDCRALAQYRQ